jgi:hypothetical protein
MRPTAFAVRIPEPMLRTDVNPASQHALFLTLFVSNAGGW